MPQKRKRLQITYDQKGPLERAVLWRGTDVIGLLCAHADKPSFRGALWAAKVIRLQPKENAAYLETETGLSLRLAGKNLPPLGQLVYAQILAPAREGKAYEALWVRKDETPEQPGLCAPPLPLWAQLKEDYAPKESVFLCVSDKALYAQIESQKNEHASQITLVKEEGDSPHPDLDELLISLRSPVVPLADGASLVIEPTRALVSIDVNKGGSAASALALNLVAVREMARQMRLRNLGGILIMDCLKMKARADNGKILKAFTQETDSDPAQVDLFGLSRLGLLEAVRARRDYALHELIDEEGNPL